MILIKGGKIKPITGAEIENGELLIGDDGKIAAIGKTVDAPADAKVIDATGCLVTPASLTRTAISVSTKKGCAGRAMTATNTPAP